MIFISTGPVGWRLCVILIICLLTGVPSSESISTKCKLCDYISGPKVDKCKMVDCPTNVDYECAQIFNQTQTKSPQEPKTMTMGPLIFSNCIRTEYVSEFGMKNPGCKSNLRQSMVEPILNTRRVISDAREVTEFLQLCVCPDEECSPTEEIISNETVEVKWVYHSRYQNADRPIEWGHAAVVFGISFGGALILTLTARRAIKRTPHI